MSGIVDAIFGNSQAAPDPNPGLIAQANASSDAAKQYADVSREQLAWSKDLAQKQLDIAAPIVKQQYDIAQQNQSNANDQWNYYKSTFQPVEQQSAADAMGYDSAARKEGLQSKAAEDIAAGYDANTGTAMRNASRYGGGANSPAALALQSSAGIARARDTALAKNAVVSGVDDKAIALRAGVANFGRNMPNTATSAFGTSLNAGNSAVGNSNSTGSTAINETGSAPTWAGTSNQSGATAGGLYNSMYQGQLSAYNTNLQSNAQMWGGIGQGAGFIASRFLPTSDETQKTDRKPVDGEAVLDGLKRIPVDSWSYKPGVEDGGRHVGPMAQDVQAQLGDAAAPDGTKLDLVTMNGMVMAGLKALNKKVDRLTRGKVGLSRVSLDGGRSTEPKKGTTIDNESGEPVPDSESAEGETGAMPAGLMPMGRPNDATYPMY